VVDLLTIAPLDDERFTQSVKKTGRAVVVHEAPRSYGPGAEIMARLVEKSFLYLEAPIRRVTGFDIVIPLFQREKDYIPSVDRIMQAARETLSF
jgi:pyruvate dehydrogenase E1 component beta subunit